MSSFSQQWLVRRVSPPGMLGCGLRDPQGQLVCHSLEEMCAPARIEKILTQFEAMPATLFTDQLTPRWTTWAFEQGHIRYVKRPDGWSLALVARAESEAVKKFDALSEEFLTVEL